jgi:hypothetical protein
MRTGTKIGLLGLAVSAITSIVFGVIEINDARKGKKRLHEEDIKLIAETIVTKQEEVKLAKKKIVKPITKES